MDIPHQHDDADDDQQKRDDDRKTRDDAASFGIDFTQCQHRVSKCADENTDRKLTRLVFQNPLHDSRRELTHCELDDNHRDREYKRSETNHRSSDRTEDFHRCIWTTAEPLRHELVVKRFVDRDRTHR